MNCRHSCLCPRLSLGLLAVLALSSFVLFLPSRCLADGLDVTITDSSQTALPGQTIVFSGTVTNDTGSDLTATDLFFGFFGFDPDLTVNQLLGTPDLSIPNGTTTLIVDLFSVGTSSGMESGTFPVDFVLQDINGNLSALGSADVTVGKPTTIPEPSSMLLLGSGLMVLGCSFRRQFMKRVPKSG
jgi:hypothetical protein